MSNPDTGATASALNNSDSFDFKGPVTVKADRFTINDATDPTKKLQFDCSGITSGETSVFTVPDVDGTYVTTAATQTLTNKTLTSPTLTTPILTTADINDASLFKNVAGPTKKFRFDVSGVTAGQSRILAVPDYNATLATIAGTETLTAKTLTSPTINAATLTGTISGGDLSPTTVNRTAQKRIVNGFARAGAGIGFVAGAVLADNIGMLATCPQLQTAATLVVPLPGLKVGDTITAFHLIGQIESGGNACTVDANLRKLTAAAADVTDASVGAIVQLSVTADTIMSAANTTKGSLAEVVGADETFYVLVTVTTAAATDVALQGIAVVVTEA